MRQRFCSCQGNGTDAPVSDLNDLPSGVVLDGRYCVKGVLGSGCCGITYIGRDLVRGTGIVVKEYFPLNWASRTLSRSPAIVPLAGSDASDFHHGREGFMREAQTLVATGLPPSVVGPCDVFEQNGTAYMVSPYIEGSAFIRHGKGRETRMDATELLHLVRPLLSALGQLHDLGFLHRDIAPDNLLLEGGHIRLVDLDCGQGPSKGSRTTRTTTAMLKCGFAPIERYARQREGAWTDVYSLCASIYQCLTGVVPPCALDRVTRDELVGPRALGVSMPAWQERALLRGMRTRPSQRFATVRELEVALYR